MSESHRTHRLRFERPGDYRIVVQGTLDQSRREMVANMKISRGSEEDGSPETVLVGRLLDQTELNGVLNSLYELHIPILSVEFLKDRQGGK